MGSSDEGHPSSSAPNKVYLRAAVKGSFSFQASFKGCLTVRA